MDRTKHFRPKFKEIWKIDLSVQDSEGHEQMGTRPCLIISYFEESRMALVIPITSNVATGRFPHTVKIEKNPINELKNDSIALVYQMRSISITRFLHEIGRMTKPKYNEIEIQLKDILRLPLT